MANCYVYILSNKNRTVLYIGYTTNLITRVNTHRKGNGAKFTKKYNAHDLLYYEEYNEKIEGRKREKQLKNWHKEWKWNLIRKENPKVLDLFESIIK